MKFISEIKSRRGFTLIELLVVISIVSLLSSIVMSATGDTRAKARDARRKSDFSQLQIALDLYHADYGDYPGDPIFVDSYDDGQRWCASDLDCWKPGGTFYTLMSPYIKLPQDPNHDNKVRWEDWFVYVYQRNSSSEYCLAAILENDNDPEITDSPCHSSWPNYSILRD